MKKKRFYGNKNRNQKWTEEPQGREIDFADKYIGEPNATDKFDKKRPTSTSVAKQKKKERNKKRVKSILTIILCIVLIAVGYTTMDVYTTRHYVSVESLSQTSESESGNMADLALNLSSSKVESVSLDASVMLSSVMSDLNENGYSSLTFDVKRSDGTIGYASSLVAIDTYSAISTPATQPATSVKELLANDILPVARICCWQDNVVPNKDKTLALTKGKKVYTDDNGNTYLNPNSDSAYSYIKDIISECYSYGITVFVLYGCTLPDDIASDYNDGFDALAKKIDNDLDGNVKLLQEVDVDIDASTTSEIKEQIKNLPEIDNNQIYYIKTNSNAKKVTAQLSKYNIQNYIIED